ncbi:zinc finger MYM-type protein 1-like [Prunus persica]|uniref:zinc finger MYM-type protein 1-like n=1 Tax=Prunus persica TaxID=3760 RepID=UPI0009AB22D1|nr:zinc finger MYM-type protein 1-like [Prunus persica]
MDYQTRLDALVGVSRKLLQQGLPFRVHDESGNSTNQGNFLAFLRWLCHFNDDIKAVMLKNPPKNMKLTSPNIQKDISSAISTEIVNAIIRDIGDSLFAILIDKSCGMSSNEQMAILLCYVDKGHVIKRFVCIVHVTNTKSSSLKLVINDFFSRHGLSISRLQGQAYDEASNMRGEFSGLKTRILNENDSAFYVHCFAHQLQLALVAMAKKHSEIAYLFTMVSNVVNVVGASANRRDMLREKHDDAVFKALNNNELLSGQDLNQETNLK